MRTESDKCHSNRLYDVMITQYKQGKEEDGTVFVNAQTSEEIDKNLKEFDTTQRQETPVTLMIHDKCPSWEGMYAGANVICYLSVETAEVLAQHLLAAVEAVKKNAGVSK